MLHVLLNESELLEKFGLDLKPKFAPRQIKDFDVEPY